MCASRSRGWRVVGASVVGRRHVSAGLGCDDDHVWQESPLGIVIGVADGAGSASRGGDGARLATGATRVKAAHLLASAGQDDPDLLRFALSETLQLARRDLEVAGAGDVFRDLATTMTVVVVGTNLLGVAHVGDGAVVVRSEAGLRLIGTSQQEYVNETVFLTSHDYLDAATFHIEPVGGVSAVAALTDGLQFLAFEMATRTPHPGFFTPMFDLTASMDSTELEEFLGSEKINAETDDDKTLVLAVRLTP